MSLEDSLYPLLRLYERAPQQIKSLVGRAYHFIPRSVRYGSAYERFRKEALEAERWGENQIEQYQIRAIRDSLTAAEKAPWYRERFAERGLRAADFESLEQIKSYPLISKSDLIVHREQMVNPEVAERHRLYITTGGSSGVPVGFYIQRGVSRPKEQAYQDAQWARRGYESGNRVAVLRGSVTTTSSRGAISYYDATRDWLILSSSHLTFERLAEYVRELERFQPLHLHAYPSSAVLLARALEESGHRLRIRLKSVLCGSERLDTKDRVYLERVLNAPVFHWYGHSERVVLAGYGRVSDNLYFAPAYGFVELGEEDLEGTREVIGTSFHNHAMPLIRYRTGDRVRLAREPHRELSGLEIEAVAGREQEFLESGTGRRVSLTTINMHDDIFDGCLAVQFAQSRPGEVEFRYQTILNSSEVRTEAMRKGLLRKLGDDFLLEIKQVDEVEKTPAGKHKWLVKS